MRARTQRGGAGTDGLGALACSQCVFALDIGTDIFLALPLALKYLPVVCAVSATALS